MKRIHALLAVLVMAGSTGSAQLIRLVAKQELSVAEIEKNADEEAWRIFFSGAGAGA